MSIFGFLGGGGPFRKPLGDVRNHVRSVLSTFVAEYSRKALGSEGAFRRARACLIFNHHGCEKMLEGLATERENAEMFRPFLSAISASPVHNIEKLFCSQALIFVNSIYLSQPENPICDVMIETALRMYRQPPSVFHDAWQCFEAKQQANPTNEYGPMWQRFSNCAMKLMYEGIGATTFNNVIADMWIVSGVAAVRDAYMEHTNDCTDSSLADSLLRG